MSNELGSVDDEERSLIRPFTKESLAAIETRRAIENATPKEVKKKRVEGEVRYNDDGPQPDAALEQGLLLPARMQQSFPSELTFTPLEDIDPFYHNQRTFVVINKGKYIFRFSATNALWVLDPFNPIRRAAINTLVHPVFSFFIIATILINCIFMVMPATPAVENAEYVFIGIYTFELAVKVIARGFLLQPFTYLRDAWNWLDFVLITMAYISLGADLDNFAVLRTFRVLRALKTVAIVPGLKTIAGAVIESMKNLGDALILSVFSLFVFALIGLQIYMGILTQKCIKVFPEDGSWGNLTNENWERFCQNETNWFVDSGEYPLCGNSSGAGQCEPGYVCLQGYGMNPNYGYTNFDTFGWALLSAFRLITQDYWESLYQMVLRSAGPWHIMFYIAIIIMGSLFLINLILAIVVMSYDTLKKKAEEEKNEEEALKKISTCKLISDKGKSDETNDKPVTEQPGRASQLDEQNAAKGDKEVPPTTFKARLFNCFMKVIDFFCVWDCCWIWLKFQKCIAVVVFHPFFELFIMLCIIINTVFMAMDHHDMDKDMETVLRSGNYFFVAVFIMEAILKLIAMSPKYYFQESWNVFDFSIVTISLLELGLEGVQGLSILRTFRVLRILRLVKSWPTFNLLLSTMGRTMNALVSLTFILYIIIFIFAVLGMQLYGKSYVDHIDRFPEEELPRWNFTDFLHSFMIVFRVLCGEWIESMWDCMLVGDASCIPFFLATVIICNLVVLNLFVALLLSNFNSSTLTANQDTNKIVQAFNRISRFGDVIKLVKNKITNQTDVSERIDKELEIEPGLKKDVINKDCNIKDNVEANISDGVKFTIPEDNKQEKGKVLIHHINIIHEQPTQVHDIGDPKNKNTKLRSLKKETTDKNNSKEELRVEDEEDIRVEMDNKSIEVVDDTPSDCCHKQCYKCFPFLSGDTNSTFWHSWSALRLKSYKLVGSITFESIIMIVIVLSSLTLTLEDIHLQYRPLLREILYYMDIIFVVIFFVEMLIKWLALGFQKYFTNAWCWLEFIIVLMSLINYGAVIVGADEIPLFRTMRTLRALRLLCVVSRWENMRVVLNALMKAIPSIINVLLVCLFFWLIFGIIGVQFFAGKFYKCIDMNYTTFSHEIIPDRKACVNENYNWENSPMNFDNIGNAYLSLFQVATFKGWIQIMNDAVDTREVGSQPIRETNIYMYLYFVFFIIFGSFLIRYLLISVIITSFREQKMQTYGSLEMFMTEDQKNYYIAMKKIKSKKPTKAVPKPTWPPQAKVFEIVTNKKFDMIIMLFIGLNMLTMAFEHYQQSETFGTVLDYFNLIFIIIFTVECLIKIFALRFHYFVDPWNLYDFFVVILSIIGLVLSDIIEKYFVSPTLLRILRIAKIGWILRPFKSARGIRTLLQTLAMSLPFFFNVCVLLFLVMFIYAIFGMFFFMHVKSNGVIDDVYNFKTFGQSMILLFQLSTSAGWDGVLNGIINEENCELPDYERGSPGNCGSAFIGITYLISYIVITYFIILNLFTAVIFDSYYQITEETQEGLNDDDYDLYYEVWQRFDPDASQYIRYDQLSDFIDMLAPPLQICKPNQDKIKSMDIPICRGGVVFCVDVLNAVTKDFFARKHPPESNELEATEPDIPSYEPVTREWRQREK